MDFWGPKKLVLSYVMERNTHGKFSFIIKDKSGLIILIFWRKSLQNDQCNYFSKTAIMANKAGSA